MGDQIRLHKGLAFWHEGLCKACLEDAKLSFFSEESYVYWLNALPPSTHQEKARKAEDFLGGDEGTKRDCLMSFSGYHCYVATIPKLCG